MAAPAQASDMTAVYDELAAGVDGLRSAVQARDAEALARATGQLTEAIARWQTDGEEVLAQADVWRERAFALRMKNMHTGRLLLADLSWVGTVMRWLQQDGSAVTYAANGARQATTPARVLDCRG